MPYDSPGDPGIFEDDDTTPPMIVSASQVGAALKTIGSLLTFGIMFTSAVVGFARDLDVQGLLIFLQRDDVAAWIASVLTGLYLLWRSRAAWKKKFREILLVKAAPDNLAVLSTDVRAPVPTFRSAIANWLDPTRLGIEDPVSPPSRARETTTQPPRMKLVGIGAGRQPAAPVPASPPPPPNRDGAPIPVLPPGDEIVMTATSERLDDESHATTGIEPAPTVEEALPEIPIIDLRSDDPLAPVQRDNTPVIS